MVDCVAALGADLDAAEPQLRALDAAAVAEPWRPGKWTRREILGHLVDSASVNHERFVRATKSDHLTFEGYDQDAWLSVQRYHEASWGALVDLWMGLNRFLARFLAVIPGDIRHQPRTSHTLDRIAFRTVPADRPATLEQLMTDYVVHLEHHLTQILGEGWAFRGTPEGGGAGRTVLETGRLVLRELTPGDLPFVAAMLGDARTMRFYPWTCTPLEARAWLQKQVDRYQRDGHGLWLVLDRESGEKVGQVGLAWQDVEGRRLPEIGWLVRRAWWRRGIATEAAIGVRVHAFTERGLDRVISLIRPVNEPSQGVALKIGMRPEREVDFHGYRHIEFAVTRP
jgi:RimJ/RimL family protein N-acetyltransferase